MGRNRKPIDIRNGELSKAEIENRQISEKKLYGDDSKLKAPSWLSLEGKKEFKRVISEMRNIEAYQNLMSNLDLGVLAIYCNAWANYVELSKQIENEGMITEYTNKAGATNTVISSYVQAQQKYIDVIFKCSAKLGLSISDRLKLVVPNLEELQENKFSKFMR